MTQDFWILMLIILLAFTIFCAVIMFFYFRISNKWKNGLVARIHMADTTIKTYRYNEIPSDDRFTIKEYDSKGDETSFTYFIKEKCIEKGNWGKYIDYDYHVSEPINPRERNPNGMMNELKELYKLIGSMLDTDLHVKLLRNSKFEDFVKLMLIIVLIVSVVGMISATTTVIKGFVSSPTDNKCVLTLDNSTWQTIYVASHVAPQTMTPVAKK